MAAAGRQLVAAVLVFLFLAAASASSASSSASTAAPSPSASKTATQPRQSPMSAAGAVLSALGALVPGLVTNVAPLVVLFGLGALMMPTLGMSAMGLLREARRSASDQMLPNMQLPAAFAQYARPIQNSPQEVYYFAGRSFPALMSSFNSAGLKAGLQDLLERVGRAIENADKRYS